MAHIAIRQHPLLGPVGHAPTPHEAPRPLVFVSHVTTGVSLLVLAAALTLGILTRTSDNGAVRLFGHEVRPVLSGSMTPEFRTGDAVIAELATAEQVATLAVGDVIVFRAPGHESMVIAHRVSMVTTNNQGDRLFTTKGDANSSDDSAMVDASHVVGVVTQSVPHLGKVMVNLGQRRTLLVFLVATLLSGFSVTLARLARRQAPPDVEPQPLAKVRRSEGTSHPFAPEPSGLHKSATSAPDKKEINA